LAAAFVIVALAAVGLVAGLTLALASSDVSHLARQQAAALAKAVAATAAATYRANGGFDRADLSSALAVVVDAGGRATITDVHGHEIAATAPHGGASGPLGPTERAAVTVDGARVGTVALQVGTTGLGAVDDRLRGALAAGVGASAGLAAALAIGAAFVASRRITHPVRALTAAVRAIGSGERQARVDGGGPGEVGELARAFDAMADSLEREDQLRRSLVADVAHELRTPLAILLATGEALADGVAEATPETLGSLKEEAQRLATRVEDLERLASAEAAGLRLSRHPVDLAVVGEEAMEAMAGRFEASGVELERRLHPIVVEGDGGRLYQVVTNLLTNALKFTPRGGRVELVVEPGPDHTARLMVVDSGVGIPPDELDRVFERFFRGKAAGEVAGSGIGLAVVAELVRAHQGRIEVASERGQGARFTVTLPRV
jgi:signal transduction histidine kinase